MSDESRVEVGQVYEAWSAAPGYPPLQWRVTGMGTQGWCWVKHLHSAAASDQPMRQSTLLTPKLGAAVSQLQDEARREASDADESV